MKLPARIVIAVGAALVAAVLGEAAWQAIAPARPASSSFIEAVRPVIGGPFRLADHTGRTVTERTFLGKVQLVFFGFTRCPDVCPTALSTIASLLDQLGQDAAKIQPIFISIDPERDTPDLLAGYVDAFHPSLVGLTGTPEQIDEAAGKFGVYYKKVLGAAEGEYSMDHTATIFILDGTGAFLSTLDYHESEGVMLEKLRRAIAKLQPL